MSKHGTPQLGAAMALVQLLQEHPELTAGTWTVDSVAGSLHGHLHADAFDALDAYAAVLGGNIRPGRDYVSNGHTLRPHILHSVWRDVRVTVGIVLPVPVAVAA
ncbi:hypothetical protein [Streptomyces sp. NPDC056069]|uniref:hypothetical protein n=1 Tax=Streptomyces sp. NPDC056069 TaxID=3345702 RepID=UPI0035E18EBF